MQKELDEKDFMKWLVECNREIQEFIKKTSFQHYNPWRIVLKEDSISAHVRMVVDPKRDNLTKWIA